MTRRAMKEQSPGFPFDAEPPVELVKRRAALTFQEREISALERISDQLALLKDMFAVCREQDPPAVTSTSSRPQGFREGEVERNAFSPSEPEIPAGITASTVTNYRVGPYNYTDLELAKAELQRQRSAR